MNKSCCLCAKPLRSLSLNYIIDWWCGYWQIHWLVDQTGSLSANYVTHQTGSGIVDVYRFDPWTGVTGLQHTDDMQTLLISQSHCPVFCGTCTSTTLSFLTVFRPGSVSSGSPSRRSSRFLPVSCYIPVSIHVSNAVHAHPEAPFMWTVVLRTLSRSPSGMMSVSGPSNSQWRRPIGETQDPFGLILFCWA